MSDPTRPLTDNEVHDRLVAAVEALGEREAETVRGRTALAAARRALLMFQIALVAAAEGKADDLLGYRPPPEP